MGEECAEMSTATAERTLTWKKFGLEALDGSCPEDRKWQTKSFGQEEKLLPPQRSTTSVDTDVAGRGQGVIVGGGVGIGGVTAIPTDPAPEPPKKLMTEICRCLDLLNLKDVDAETLVKAANSSSQRLGGDSGPGESSAAPVDTRPMRRTDQDDQTVRVTNLPDFVTSADLDILFNRIGDVQRTFLVRNKETNVSRGFAFITFRYKSDAQKAISVLNGKGFMGSVLTVECARRKAD